MELNCLKSFLQIAREGNMTRASESLHLTQSALSKQVKELESELGHKLFVRQGRLLSLTEEGMLLRKRAEDIVSLVAKTTAEFQSLEELDGGEISIGVPESIHMDLLAAELLRFRSRYPHFRCHLLSGMTEQLTGRLEQGLLDLVIISGMADLSRYNQLRYPADDEWGVAVRDDHPLARLEKVSFNELRHFNLMVSPQGLADEIIKWSGDKTDELNVLDTVNLCYNGTLFVKAGVAVLLTYKGLVNTSAENGLCYRPLEPKLYTPLNLIWKKYQVFTPLVELFVKQLSSSFREQCAKLQLH
ncbi:MAG: LysR family transcriptional regulator [Succinivibrio sp.]|nr:LysR family transcriptional regulator [Succinivibrio sp.]